MRKLFSLMLCAALLCTGIALAEPQVLTGKGQGYVGVIEVEVTLDGDKITDVKVINNSETPSVAGTALEQIPEAIKAANSAEVDVIAKATYTSKGIMAAVKNAIDPENNPYVDPNAAKEEAAAEDVAAAEAYIGFGLVNDIRKGPGADDTETQVWSINQVFANVLFDAEGKILYSYVDQLEVATPNYDGATMPHFTGFPGQSYNIDTDHDAKVDGTETATEESFLAQIASWQTKRERGTGYVMGTGTWDVQMDTFQKVFQGKTVEEVEAW
ncbi:MAG: FMN-binding protein, partial [Clostridia bacterium]|nr:FMN-binding protein [Clostridia bacterium]